MGLNYASLGRRIWGGFIDFALSILLFLLFAMSFGTKTGEGTFHLGGLPTSIMLVIWFLYYFILEATTGKTIGKYIAKTKVVTLAGNKITWGQSFVRNILRVVDGLLMYLVAVIVIASTKKKQRIGDLVAKTVVIK